MTSRERFRQMIKNKKSSQSMIDLAGCPQTQIMYEDTVRDLRRALHLPEDNAPAHYYGGGLDERILRQLHVDTRITGGFPQPEGGLRVPPINGEYTDEWGIGYRFINGHYEICRNPLKDMDLDDIRRYPFPRAEDIRPELYESYAQHARRLHETTDLVVVAQHPVYGVFELGCWMFGFDDFLYRLAGEPETVHWFFEKILDYQKAVIRPYYTALGPFIDCTTSGDDFGTQHGLFMSVSMFQELVAPYLKERIRYTKSFTSAAFQHHSCGSVFDLIPTLIDCGVDLLNPIQPGATKMEPEILLDAYAGSIAFWGGVDTQDLLVNGTPEKVKAETHRLLHLFDGRGAYVLSPAHCIQDDVPAENLLAVYEAAAEEYGL